MLSVPSLGNHPKGLDTDFHVPPSHLHVYMNRKTFAIGCCINRIILRILVGSASVSEHFLSHMVPGAADSIMSKNGLQAAGIQCWG